MFILLKKYFIFRLIKKKQILNIKIHILKKFHYEINKIIDRK